MTSIQVRLSNGLVSPVFGESDPDKTWELPQGKQLKQIGIKQVENSHICGINMFADDDLQVIQTLEEKNKGEITITPGYWTHFRLKQHEKILGIHGVVQVTPMLTHKVTKQVQTPM
jgi:hypothetical protein